MNVRRLLTAKPGLALAASLVLVPCHPSGANAETFTGVAPGKSMSFSIAPGAETGGNLTLKDALLLALRHNPELAAFDKEIRALEGTTLQAGLLPNPELSVNVDNVGNIGAGNGQRVAVPPGTAIKETVEQQDLIIRISQLFELGGKRAARVNAASLGRELAVKEYEAKRLEIIARVANAFIEVLSAQEQLQLAEESQRLAQRVVEAVKRRVQAGKVPPIEETKVGIAFSTTRIALLQTQRELEAARKRLALLWGEGAPEFARVLGNLQTLAATPSFDALVERVLASPIADRARKGIEHRRALLELEQTRRVPNITIAGGMIKHWESGGTTGIVGIAMPLQLFDRNQGNLREANQRLNKALDEQVATDLRLKTELVQTYEALLAAHNEITILRSEVLPAATSAFEVTNKGYELGKFSFLEVLDAQRTLFQNRTLYMRVLANYHRLVNEIERLTAAHLLSDEDPLADQVVSDDVGTGSRRVGDEK